MKMSQPVRDCFGSNIDRFPNETIESPIFGQFYEQNFVKLYNHPFLGDHGTKGLMCSNWSGIPVLPRGEMPPWWNFWDNTGILRKSLGFGVFAKIFSKNIVIPSREIPFFGKAPQRFWAIITKFGFFSFLWMT
jgi:hypothetical protein